MLKDLKLDFCTQGNYCILYTVPFLRGGVMCSKSRMDD